MEHMQINCFMKTVILNEVYLASGFASRQTRLLSPETTREETRSFSSTTRASSGRSRQGNHRLHPRPSGTTSEAAPALSRGRSPAGERFAPLRSGPSGGGVACLV